MPRELYIWDSFSSILAIFRVHFDQLPDVAAIWFLVYAFLSSSTTERRKPLVKIRPRTDFMGLWKSPKMHVENSSSSSSSSSSTHG